VSRSSRCRSAPRRPRRLDGPADALELLLLAADEPQRPQTICLLARPEHPGGVAVVFDGVESDDDIDLLCELMVAACRSGDRIALGSVRPDDDHLPTALDELRWVTMRRRFESVGIELLDWFLLAGGDATSLAEWTDSDDRWHA